MTNDTPIFVKEMIQRQTEIRDQEILNEFWEVTFQNAYVPEEEE